MQVTGTAQRDAWRARELPPVEQVRPGIWSIPVPIPDNPLRYTLSYALELGSALVVVDPGWDAPSTWEALIGGLAQIGTDVADVTGVLVTHVHPDHHGLSARVRAESGAWVAMHPAERDSMPSRARVAARVAGEDARWLTRCGVPSGIRAELVVNLDRVEQFLSMAQPDRLIEDGDEVPESHGRIRAVWTPGHTPGHLCLHDELEDLLFTGDHVLPRISPNIGLGPQDDPTPLAAYLESLDTVRAYDGAEVLPAHEYRFRGVGSRVTALQSHHEHRCLEMIDALEEGEPMTVWEVAQDISWSRGWEAISGFMRRAAIAETNAHLQYLSDQNRVFRLEEDGVWLWSLRPADDPLGPG